MDINIDRWLLPDGIDEVLPEEARQLEALRRRLLDLFGRWGYELVIPPFVEYIESLLTGMGHDLDLQTFKLIDQRNGRLMGVHADMTPQVARIDAHRLGRDLPTRLCYLGTVLRTKGDDFGGSRSITQIGAELYGHSGIECDTELLSLMLEMLQAAQIKDVYVDLGHVGIFGGLAKQAKLDVEQEATLFDALQRKAAPEIAELLTQWALDQDAQQMLSELVWLNGDSNIIAEARQKLASANADVHQALDDLQNIAERLQAHYPDISLHFDLAELRGYHYHTGLVFAAYQPGMGQAIAQGGRYDEIGKVFGRARPATGFSADLRALLSLGVNEAQVGQGIFAPVADNAADNDALDQQIRQLRQAGECVVRALPGQNGDARDMGCDRRLALQGKQWIVEKID
jgi:ATP phosphoribosyltransferase regulatory subunit